MLELAQGIFVILRVRLFLVDLSVQAFSDLASLKSQSPVDDRGKVIGNGSRSGSGSSNEEGVGVNAPTEIKRSGEQHVNPAPDKSIPVSMKRRPQETLQADGGGKPEETKSSMDRQQKEWNSQLHSRSRHAGRSTRLIGSPCLSREGISWVTRLTPRGSPMTRVSGAAGLIREDRSGKLSRLMEGNVDSSSAVGVSALLSGRRQNSMSSVDLTKSSLGSTGVGSDSEIGDDGEGFVERGNAEMGGKGVRTPRSAVETGSNPSFLDLLTTTSKVSI